jgi:pimeloyl-ACP methyl ester carboxylesterase
MHREHYRRRAIDHRLSETTGEPMPDAALGSRGRAPVIRGLSLGGNMVGYAFVQRPERVTRFVLIDAPLPGIGPWQEILKNPLLWHFRFGGPDMERLAAGRERIHLDRFWNEFSATPSRFTAASREHYAKLYALPGAMHSGRQTVRAARRDALGFRPVRSLRSGRAR